MRNLLRSQGVGFIEALVALTVATMGVRVTLDSVLDQKKTSFMGTMRWRAQMQAKSISSAITSMNADELVVFIEDYFNARGIIVCDRADLTDLAGTYLPSNGGNANFTWFSRWESDTFVNRVHLNILLLDGSDVFATLADITGGVITASNIKRDWTLLVNVVVDYNFAHHGQMVSRTLSFQDMVTGYDI